MSNHLRLALRFRSTDRFLAIAKSEHDIDKVVAPDAVQQIAAALS